MFTYVTRYGDDIYVAACLQRLLWEIAHHPEYKNLTNEGEIGDQSHQDQGTASDHNPFIVHITRLGKVRKLVRAVDIGGDPELLKKLRMHLAQMYANGDRRLFRFGYCKGPDSKITSWTEAPTHHVQFHIDSGDEGHLHISVTQEDGFNPSAHGWVPPLSWRRSWGITSGGHIAARRHKRVTNNRHEAKAHAIDRPYNP